MVNIVGNQPERLPAPVPAQREAVSTWRDRLAYAEMLAKAELLPSAYRRRPADVLLAMETAEALGIPTITALTLVHVIDGKPTISPELMRALAHRAGHKVRVVESTAESCTIEVVRRDDPTHRHRSTFTMADAKQAGLLKQGAWSRYPKSMLLARATAAAIRAAAPDVLLGVSYTSEELGDWSDEADPAPVADPPPVVLEAAVADEAPPSKTDLDLFGPYDDPLPALRERARAITDEGLTAMLRHEWNRIAPRGWPLDLAQVEAWAEIVGEAEAEWQLMSAPFADEGEDGSDG